MQSDDGECQNVGWEDFVSYYSEPTGYNANDRAWLYQTCNEFGFYQTCESDSSCPYARGYHGVDMDLELCERLFGIGPDEVRKRVEGTLAHYGGRSLVPGAEGADGRRRLLFVTGDVDPWTELAMSEGDSDHPVISVEGEYFLCFSPPGDGMPCRRRPSSSPSSFFADTDPPLSDSQVRRTTTGRTRSRKRTARASPPPGRRYRRRFRVGWACHPWTMEAPASTEGRPASFPSRRRRPRPVTVVWKYVLP